MAIVTDALHAGGEISTSEYTRWVLKLAISISQTVPERDINIPRKAPFSCPSIRSKLSIYYVIIDRESGFYEFYFFKFVNVTEL